MSQTTKCLPHLRPSIGHPQSALRDVAEKGIAGTATLAAVDARDESGQIVLEVLGLGDAEVRAVEAVLRWTATLARVCKGAPRSPRKRTWY